MSFLLMWLSAGPYSKKHFAKSIFIHPRFIQFWAEIMHKKLLLSYEKDIEQIASGTANHLIFW